MTTYGLIYTLLLLVITLVILAFAFWGQGARKFTRLQDVYRDKYLDETETLDDDLKRGKIDQETYDETKVELAQDLLAVAHKDRQLSPMTKAITLAFGIAIVGGSAVYFWGEGYTEDAKNLDTQRTLAMPYVKIWLESTSIEDLQRGSSLMDLNPPVQIQENLLGTLASLNLMSSRDHHTDPKELNLLGKIYLNMDQLDLAEKTYLDLYRLDPNNTNTYYTLLNIQLAKNEYKLDARLEALFDQFVMNNPENESLLLYYGTVLFENQKVDKALHYFTLLANLYPEGSENRQVIMNMVSGLTGQMNMQAGQGQESAPATQEVMNAVTIPVSIALDEAVIDGLPEEAILYLFVRNSEMGPPLAAKRIPVATISAFPLELEITEQDLLIPGTTLSGQENLSISAKISLNGDPVTKAGDIEAETTHVTDTQDTIEIILNKVAE